jgi:hypothetical protein
MMEINQIQKIVENNGIVFISYGGFITQALISSMTEALEKEVEANDINMGVSNNIFTVFIELSQNMMNYSKTSKPFCRDILPGGLIIVSKDTENNTYSVDSQNIVSKDDMVKIEPKLVEIQGLDRDGLKKRYRELRRSGKGTHEKGGGIGFYEIAKRCLQISYEFKSINEDKFFFHFNATISADK